MGKLSEPSPITPLAFHTSYGFIIFIKIEISIWRYNRLPQANDHNYFLNTTAQTVQTTYNQRSANDTTNVQPTFSQRYNQRAANDAIAKRNFPKFRLRSTNSLFKPNQITEPLDHQRLKAIKFTNISIYNVLATCKWTNQILLRSQHVICL